MNKQRIIHIKVDELIPYASNARTHSHDQVSQIAASIREFGFTNPILVQDDNTIIAGHGRLMAANKLGMNEVPCIKLSHLSDAQARALVLADNKLALNAGWDDAMLSAEIARLNEDDFDVSLTGFSDEDLSGLVDDPEQSDIDAEPQMDKADELREKWGTDLGQIWQLGDHRLMCGDSTSDQAVTMLMDGATADLVFTSPPYGQQRDYRDGSTEKVSEWDTLMHGVFSSVQANSKTQILVNLGLIHTEGEWDPYWSAWVETMRNDGWRRFGWYVWDQGSGLMGDWNGRLGPSHEWVFHFNRESVRPRKWVEKKDENIKDRTGGGGLRKKDGSIGAVSSGSKFLSTHKIPDSVIRISRNATIDMARESHPATFPIQLPEYFIKSWDGNVYEPFCGSGTTIIACERLGRKCYAMELSPAYVAVAIQRWADATGNEPKMIHRG